MILEKKLIIILETINEAKELQKKDGKGVIKIIMSEL